MEANSIFQKQIMVKPIIVITGPTGTGKTALGIEVLQYINGIIISADSRQVYKGVDYVTNKISPDTTQGKFVKHDGYWLQDGVTIYGYDVVSPDQEYNVTTFVLSSCDIIYDAWKSGKVPVVVGGTGFYVDALLGHASYSTVGPNEILRNSLREKTSDQLLKVLESVDPVCFNSLNKSDQNNPQRLIRYIEVASEVGSVKDGLTFSPLRSESDIDIYEYVLTSEYPELYRRSDKWIQKLIESNVLGDETEYLIREFPQTRLLEGLLFRTAKKYIASEITSLEMQQVIIGELHTYIRQQVHWLRRRPQRTWVNILEPGYEKFVVEGVKRWYDK